MSKMKQRKRLAALGIVFLLVFLAGSAFAFVPGMLDVVGRVGIREGAYVQWIYAATQGTATVTHTEEGTALATLNTPGTQRIGFRHSVFEDATFGPDQFAAAMLRAAHHIPGAVSAIDPNIYLSHARIVDARGRDNQRVEWSVIFTGPGTATLYVQAMNISELSPVTISNARIVALTNVGSIAPYADFDNEDWLDNPRNANYISSAGLESMFTVSGTFAGLNQTLPANVATFGNALSSTGIHTVTVEWNGDIDLLGDAAGATRWQFVETVDITDPTDIQITGTWVDDAGDPAGSEGMSIFPDNASDGDIFMTVVNDAGALVPFDDLENWIGTFILEFDYELGTGPAPTPAP